MIKTRLSRGTVLVRFELPAAASANSVAVCGDFNQWSPAAHPLARADGEHFCANVELTAGRRWHFRYLLDGERWENDWAADDYVANVHGTEDSVVDLTDTSAMPLAPTASPPDADPDQDAESATGSPEATLEPRRAPTTPAAPAKPRKKAAPQEVGPVAAPARAPAKARKTKAPDSGATRTSAASGSVKSRKTPAAGPATRQPRAASATPPSAEAANDARSTARSRKPPTPKPGRQTESGSKETTE